MELDPQADLCGATLDDRSYELSGGQSCRSSLQVLRQRAVSGRGRDGK